MSTKPDDSNGQQGASDELAVSSLATSNALAKLLIEKSIITGAEFTAKVSAERAIFKRIRK
ncbi:MAG: hypothetical protein E6J89_14480 [Deltaproteobacteria bacterium]|nr:MAG: hypothetical protein E6J89_14480 [Deltaproteobacteria bacterium]